MKKTSEKNKKLLEALFIIFSILLILGMIFILNSRVDVKVECGVKGLSFDVNQTYDLENISLSDGEIECNLEGSVPFWFLLK